MLRIGLFASVRVLLACGTLCCAAGVVAAEPTVDTPAKIEQPKLEPKQPELPLPGRIELREFLVLPAVGNYGRLPLHQDAVEAQIVTGKWQTPSNGTTVAVASGEEKTWKPAAAETSGVLDTRTLRGGYALAQFDSPVERVMLLHAAGHAAVYVNGTVRAGDPYGLGWFQVPVVVRSGENDLLFHLAGEQLLAQLVAPPDEVFFLDADHTLPTLVRGESEPVWAAVPVVNASREWLRDMQIECECEGGEKLVTPVPPIAPLSVRKSAFQVSAESGDSGQASDFEVRLTHKLKDQPALATTPIRLEHVGPSDVHVRTFRSRIDGSVQPYAVRPATANGAASDATPPGIIISLHDAGVDCIQQAATHEASNWAHVVAPQGRRPYGFDWEDWGRIDVLEAVADARKLYPNDPRRTYLTGQGMGGHGTWHLGVTYPDQFAAIAPSAAWASFWSYGGGMPSFENPSRFEALLLRGYSPSDTVELLTNLSDVGVFVVHGEVDRTVPIEQSRFMRGRLAGFHTNFAYYEHPAEELPQSGNDGDWPHVMAFFERLSRPDAAERTTIDFATATPGISSRYDWIAIESQVEPLKPSRAVVRQDIDTRTFVGQTSNVARLAIDVDHLPPGQPIDVALDGQQLQWNSWPEDEHKLWFERSDNQWSAAEPLSPRNKSPERDGMFKSAFDHGALLVYGTIGNDDENRWAEAKARYDAEAFWYRGGGSWEIVPDKEFDVARTIGRSVIVYGNSDTNSAWSALLSTSPVRIKRGELRVGDHVESGDDLAILMVYPRGDCDAASIGVVAGTGPSGMAATNRCRYFVSGIAYPDLMVFGANALAEGTSAIRAWGFFGPDWATDSGDIAWRDGE